MNAPVIWSSFSRWSLRLWLVSLICFSLFSGSLFLGFSYTGELFYQYGGAYLGYLALIVSAVAVGVQIAHLYRARTLRSSAALAFNVLAALGLLVSVWFVYVITHSGV